MTLTVGPIPITNQTANDAWLSLRNPLQNAVSYTKQIQDQVATNAGNFSSQSLLSLVSWANVYIAAFNIVAANSTLVSALVPYIQTQVGNVNLDVATGLTNAKTTLTNLITATKAEFPADVSGNLLFQKMDASGTFIFTNFAAGAFPQTSAAFNAWLATIA